MDWKDKYFSCVSDNNGQASHSFLKKAGSLFPIPKMMKRGGNMKIRYVKIALDAVMTILMIVLMNVSATGFFWHEALGLFILGLFAWHTALNWQWVTGVASSLFSDRLKTKTRFMFMLNALLLVCMGMTMTSGILISKSLFPFIQTTNSAAWSSLHSSFAYASLVLVSVHLGMHWKSIMGAFRRMFDLRTENRGRALVVRALAAILVVIGLRNTFSSDLMGKIFLTQASGITLVSDSVPSADLLSGTTVSNDTSSDAVSTTLEEYLGNLHCTACHRNCSLLSPKCGKGTNQANQAEAAYEALVQQNTAVETTVQDTTAQTVGATSADSGADSESGLVGTFAETLPVMTLFAAGTYYTVDFMDKRKRK